MGTASFRPHSNYLNVVFASHVSLLLLLSLPGTAILAVGEISRDIPFLDTDDPATICSNAVHYISPLMTRETYGIRSLPQPETVTLATRPATDGTRPETQTAMSGSSIIISVNSTIYIPRQPLQGNRKSTCLKLLLKITNKQSQSYFHRLRMYSIRVLIILKGRY